MKTNSLKGTRDYLPKEAALREFMQDTILECYRENGFQRIMTPAIEDIENLDKSDGGDNLNLIFRIMKRGNKLEQALKNGGQLCDIGLRYDLTLPLSRYYNANREKLSLPFKCIQIDKVYRAERPQKARMREFTQCDIDIIGDSTTACETELIAITAKALNRLGLDNFAVKINDRKILNALLESFGFEKSMLESVCISFDKLDKIGRDGVIDELKEKFGNEEVSFENVINRFEKFLENTPESIDDIKSILPDNEDISRLEEIIKTSQKIAGEKYRIEFDVSLVRGQGYYTGTIFEIYCDNFGGAVAGGGRYDKLIGKFCGNEVCACGFSIGFERIFSLLSDMGKSAKAKPLIALIYSDFSTAYDYAEKLRKDYSVSLFNRPKNMKKFLDKLCDNGFSGFVTDTKKEITLFDKK